MIVTVQRQQGTDGKPCRQSFDYPAAGRQTAASVIEALNAREPLLDREGRPAGRIAWDCSCMQKMCGACAMRVNGRPVLACDCFIDTDNTEELLLEPLGKFPVRQDLAVDRSRIHEDAGAGALFLGTRTATEDAALWSLKYAAAKCLKCGLCLEVCPQYGPQEPEFFGAAFAAEAFLLHAQSADRRAALAAAYREHFADCRHCGACERVCPAHAIELNKQTL